ncbi:S1C family serine protease [Syntrophomonas palmitatica]|uniref:S1C family serine protease n=1 Tax=Syntrophomonas palmitatica TaxID=402877 RepID=UPI003F712A61
MNGQKVIRPYMGISMADINDEIIQKLNLPASIQGVLIMQVMSGSPAAVGGIKAGDIIQKVNGKEVNAGTDIQSIVEHSKVGQKLEIQIWRSGKTGTVSVTLQAKP